MSAPTPATKASGGVAAVLIVAAAAVVVALIGAYVARALLRSSAEVEGIVVQGNMNVIYLQTASTDVLRQHGVAMRTVPQCVVEANNSNAYNCAGTTESGQKISVSVLNASAEDPLMSVTVGGKQIFNGSAIDVIQQNARTKP